MFLSFEVRMTMLTKHRHLIPFQALMRGFARFKDTPLEVRLTCFGWLFTPVKTYVLQVSTGTANFLSGGLASFAFWVFAIPADNIKK